MPVEPSIPDGADCTGADEDDEGVDVEVVGACRGLVGVKPGGSASATRDSVPASVEPGTRPPPAPGVAWSLYPVSGVVPAPWPSAPWLSSARSPPVLSLSAESPPAGLPPLVVLAS